MSDEPKGIEEMIKKAIAEGEFDDLPGKGRPLDLNPYFDTPEDLRMGYSILKSAEFVPEEVQLLKEVEAMREELKSCRDEERRRALSRSINERSLSYNLLMERRRRRSKS